MYSEEINGNGIINREFEFSKMYLFLLTMMIFVFYSSLLMYIILLPGNEQILKDIILSAFQPGWVHKFVPTTQVKKVPE